MNLLLNSSSGITMFVIFGLLIVVMISIAVYGSIKERNNKIVQATTKKTKNLSVKEFYLESIFKLEIMAEELEHDVKSFKPSVGKKTMKQISTDALCVIKNIEKSEIYFKLKESDKYGPILTDIIKDLKKNTPTKWHKTSFSSLNIVKAKADAYKKNNKVIYNKIRNGENNDFTK